METDQQQILTVLNTLNRLPRPMNASTAPSPTNSGVVYLTNPSSPGNSQDIFPLSVPGVASGIHVTSADNSAVSRAGCISPPESCGNVKVDSSGAALALAKGCSATDCNFNVASGSQNFAPGQPSQFVTPFIMSAAPSSVNPQPVVFVSVPMDQFQKQQQQQQQQQQPYTVITIPENASNAVNSAFLPTQPSGMMTMPPTGWEAVQYPPQQPQQQPMPSQSTYHVLQFQPTQSFPQQLFSPAYCVPMPVPQPERVSVVPPVPYAPVVFNSVPFVVNGGSLQPQMYNTSDNGVATTCFPVLSVEPETTKRGDKENEKPLGVRGFLGPKSIGTREVPGAPVITTLPPLALPMPDWGTVPPATTVSA